MDLFDGHFIDMYVPDGRILLLRCLASSRRFLWALRPFTAFEWK
jgi:hypothetical protein